MDGVLIREEPAEGVLLLTLNRPCRRNALDLALTDALMEAFGDLRSGPRWRCAILTGRAPAFCAGLDLNAFAAPDAPRGRVTEMIRSIAALGKPVIAAVNGAVYTGGLEMVLASDFALASEEARFADTHAKIGALSGSGMGARLPHAVGARFARQMMLACQPIDAATALRTGLVNEVLPPDRLLPRAIEIAAAIAAHDPELIAIARDVIDRGTHATLAEALTIETEALERRKAAGAMRWTR